MLQYPHLSHYNVSNSGVLALIPNDQFLSRDTFLIAIGCSPENSKLSLKDYISSCIWTSLMSDSLRWAISVAGCLYVAFVEWEAQSTVLRSWEDIMDNSCHRYKGSSSRWDDDQPGEDSGESDSRSTSGDSGPEEPDRDNRTFAVGSRSMNAWGQTVKMNIQDRYQEKVNRNTEACQEHEKYRYNSQVVRAGRSQYVEIKPPIQNYPSVDALSHGYQSRPDSVSLQLTDLFLSL